MFLTQDLLHLTRMRLPVSVSARKGTFSHVLRSESTFVLCCNSLFLVITTTENGLGITHFPIGCRIRFGVSHVEHVTKVPRRLLIKVTILGRRWP